MQSYRVRWEIDVEAESPIEAAKDVWRRRFGRSYPPAPDSCCQFEVQDEKGPTGKYGWPLEAKKWRVDLGEVAQAEGLELAADDRPALYSPYLIELLAGYRRLMQSLQGDGQDYTVRLKEVAAAIGRLGDPAGVPMPITAEIIAAAEEAHRYFVTVGMNPGLRRNWRKEIAEMLSNALHAFRRERPAAAAAHTLTVVNDVALTARELAHVLAALSVVDRMGDPKGLTAAEYLVYESELFERGFLRHDDSRLFASVPGGPLSGHEVDDLRERLSCGPDEPLPIIVLLEGGLVQGVQNVPVGMRVQVKDYDVEHIEDPDALETDTDGDSYLLTTFTHEDCDR